MFVTFSLLQKKEKKKYKSEIKLYESGPNVDKTSEKPAKLIKKELNYCLKIKFRKVDCLKEI